MTSADYDRLAGELMTLAREIETSKRPGYTVSSGDVLQNFKAAASRAGITPEQAWVVLVSKHFDAITAIMAHPDLPVSEAPSGRFADAINYLRLGWALLAERSSSAAPTVRSVTAFDISSETYEWR